MSNPDDPADIGLGQAVYDDEGTRLGTVRGFDEHGFYVTTDEGIDALSSEHIATGAAAEAELMWRCANCGEMGDLEAGFPDTCPNCGVEKEQIYYWTED